MERLFKPWIGENYMDAPFGKRVLLLGISCYHPPNQELKCDKEDLVVELARDAIGYPTYRNTSSFYTKPPVMFGLVPGKLEDRKQYWKSVAYYNYLQRILDGPRQGVPGHLWNDSYEPFLQTLDELRPDLVIVFGKTKLWPAVSRDANAIEPASTNPFSARATLSRPNGEVLLFGTKHPSSGFSGTQYYPILQEILRS